MFYASALKLEALSLTSDEKLDLKFYLQCPIASREEIMAYINSQYLQRTIHLVSRQDADGNTDDDNKPSLDVEPHAFVLKRQGTSTVMDPSSARLYVTLALAQGQRIRDMGESVNKFPKTYTTIEGFTM